MKASPIANEEKLRVQQEKKQIYLLRVKESIATATPANLVTEQNDDSAFSQFHIRSRSIQKVAKTHSKNPRKRREAILALANKFKLSIKPPNRKQEDQKPSSLKVKKNGSKTIQINSILHMSLQIEKITVMLEKVMVKDSMSRSDILHEHSIIY